MKLKKTMILAACSVISLSGCEDQQIKSWTLRCDHDAMSGGCSPIVKRLLSKEECDKRNPPPLDCKEVLTVDQFVQMIKQNEGKTFGIALTPSGAQAITDEIKSCRIDLDACRSSHK